MEQGLQQHHVHVCCVGPLIVIGNGDVEGLLCGSNDLYGDSQSGCSILLFGLDGLPDFFSSLLSLRTATTLLEDKLPVAERKLINAVFCHRLSRDVAV